MRFRDGTVLLKQDGPSQVKKIDSYAGVTDHYNFCITNTADKQEFIVSFYQGLEVTFSKILS